MTTQNSQPPGIALVTFVSRRSRTTARVPLDASRAKTLLAVAREHRVPILFTCEVGGCGACVVRVRALNADTEPVPLTDSEDFLLPLLTAPEPDGAMPAELDLAHNPLRLACQYMIGRGEILVMFTDLHTDI